MITCPNCHHQELPGVLFCSECGAQLSNVESLTTQSIRRTPSELLDSMEQSLPPLDLSVPEPLPETGSIKISLLFVESGKIVDLTGRSEFTLGRATEGQPILPDVDLAPYDAYSQGVSRFHASLKIVSQRISIVDLGSSNGTRVNGQKIVPNVDYPLSHGDILALGKFKIQVLIHY